MWILMKYYIGLIGIWWVSHLIAAECPKDDKPIDWNLRGNESEIPVHNFKQILSNDFVSETPILKLHAENFKENFTFILFASPRDKNNPYYYCPSEIRQNIDIRRHRCVIRIPKSAPYCDVSFDAIMTGCFYVVIRNAEGMYWQFDPVFYKTDFTYVDTKLELVGNDTRPERRGSSREILPVIKVPLRCIQVNATLYEFEGNVPNATVYGNNRILPEGSKDQQSCTIFYDGNRKTVERGCTEKNTNLTIDADLSDEENDTWTAKITWKNLRRGGNTCYMTFYPVLANDCLDLAYLYSWLQIDPIIFYGGKCNESNDPSETGTVDIPLIVRILCSIMGVIGIAILVYWKFKYSRFITNKEYEESEESGIRDTFLFNSDEGESDQILIMYAKGPSLVMRAIDDLKRDLNRECNFRIRDVYELNEWTDVADLGATEWVERQLKAGSRVVWIDTPQFRSLLNDKEKKYTGDDFRDEALPHAVDLAKTLFQDATTQYRRHFVVRMKGFEVDDQQADPLETFTPYTRYHLPGHLSALCEHLNNCTSQPLENGKNV